MILDVFPEAYIYSFEPLPEPFGELRKWAMQQKERVKVEIFNHIKYNPSSFFRKQLIFETKDVCLKQLLAFLFVS